MNKHSQKEEKITPMHLFSLQGRWFYLFHALIALLVIYPYIEPVTTKTHPPYLLAFLNSALILAIVYTASYNFRQFALAFILAAPALVLIWMPYFPYAEVIILASTGLLYLYAIILLLSYLIHREKISTEEIFGATSIYLLLGFVWATLYELLEITLPGSFYISPAQNLDGVLNWSDFIFFSFTTLTTLGYGDITPITSNARSLAILEAVTGVIFLASALSRIISIYVAETLADKRNKAAAKEMESKQ